MSNTKNTRMCMICRVRKDKSALTRIEKKDGHIIKAGSKTSRGYYICKDDICINKAVSKKLLNKIMRTAIDSDDYEALKK